MSSVQQKLAFSKRLLSALKAHSNTVKGASDLARLFNAQHHTGMGISLQTAHKWLTGRAIPTEDRMKTLAVWLGVSEHWLHYGPPPESAS